MKVKMRILGWIFAICVALGCFYGNAQEVCAMEFREENLFPCKLHITVESLVDDCDETVTVYINNLNGNATLYFAKEYRNIEETVMYDFLGETMITTLIDGNEWEVVDKNTMKSPDMFEMTSGGDVYINLMIVPTAQNKEWGEYAEELKSGELLIEELIDQLNKENNSNEQNTSSNNNVGNSIDLEKGKELYADFLKNSSFIKDDVSWSGMLGTYDKVLRIAFEESYLKNVKDATKESYAELSSYDLFVYIETYLRFANLIGSIDIYSTQGEKGVNQFFNTYSSLLNGNNAESVSTSLKGLVDWQMEYYRYYGFPYNFITEQSYAEEKFEEIFEPPTEVVEDVTEKEIEDAMSNLDQEEIKESETEEKGIWGSTLERLAKNWLTIIILAVLAIALLIVRHIIKVKNIEDK